jgi:hypothetical protein
MEAKALAAVEAGHPPVFLFGTNTDYYYGQWAYEDRLVELSDVIRPFASLFDPDALAYATLFDATTGRRALYALPMGFSTHHLHVWRNLLEQAFTIDDIPSSGRRFGRSGAMRCSQRCARPPAATMSMARVWPCRSRMTPRTDLSSSCRPTRPTT